MFIYVNCSDIRKSCGKPFLCGYHCQMYASPKHSLDSYLNSIKTDSGVISTEPYDTYVQSFTM